MAERIVDMEGINWIAIGVGVTAAASLLGANAWLMRVVIKSCLNEALLSISKEYVSKSECFSHRAARDRLNQR